MATDKGIDYSLGTANRDPETGISYGVIPLADLGEYAIEDFEPDYGEPHCPKCGNEAQDIDDIEEDTDTWEHEPHGCDDYVCPDCKYVFDSQWAFGDEPVAHTYEQNGYAASLDSYNDVFILKSPYFTHAQFCSPCAPGAGYLSNPCPDGPKTYCFGHDWFEGGKAPYPVYSIETGELVQPE